MNADTQVTSPTPVGCTNFKLRQLTRRVTQHYDQHLAGSGLKITQYSLLTHVDRLGPLAPGELARRMDMGASTLTRNLQPMIAAGWLTLGEGVDARSRRVHLTDAGRDIRRQPRSMAVKRQAGHSLTSSESLILRDAVVSRRLLSSTRALALPQCRTLDGKSRHAERTHFSRPAAAAIPSAARTPCSRVRRPVR